MSTHHHVAALLAIAVAVAGCPSNPSAGAAVADGVDPAGEDASGGDVAALPADASRGGGDGGSAAPDGQAAQDGGAGRGDAAGSDAADGLGPADTSGALVDGGGGDAAGDAGDTGGLPDSGPDAGPDFVDVVGGGPDADAGGSDAADGGPPAEPMFTVLSLNLHCLKTEGTPYADNTARFAAVAALADAEGVDLLLVQEACEAPGVSAIGMLAEELQAATGQPWHNAWAFAHLAWEGTPDEASEGLGLLARAPLLDQGTLVYAVQGSLQRLALSATVAAPGGELRATTVHLDFSAPEARLAQARETANAALVDAPALASLVAGDFNDTAGSAPHGALGQWGFLDQSAPLDPGRIDHVFLHRGAPWRASEATLVFDTPQTAVSDHPGVLVRLAPHAPDEPLVTQLDITADVGFGHFVSVRGSSSPLSWDHGWPARSVGADAWRLICTELPAGLFTFKSLRDDTAWQLGEDEAGVAGQTTVSAPSFP